MSPRRICVLTTTRADYGLLSPSMEALRGCPEIALDLLVTGTHLCPEFGLTVQEILQDGWAISKRVEMILSSDSPVGIAKSMGLGLISFAEAFQDLSPDLILLLGDRFEAFAAAAAATVARIPIAHCHGGETTEGAVDEAFRHSITKMSHLHFVSTAHHRDRVIQLGEHPDRVFVVGALGLENVHKLTPLSRQQLSESLSMDLDGHFVVVTFHPVTLESSTSHTQMQALLGALDAFPDLKIIITLPNADVDGRVLFDLIDEFVAKNPRRAASFPSLGRLRYLSAVAHSVGVVGNSSSGLLEAPSLQVGTVDIGDRQKGRTRADSVISCAPDTSSITEALARLQSPSFRQHVKTCKNPYWHGCASEKIVEVLSGVSLDNILKKRFQDLEVPCRLS
jgi:GDP/UDP-N,N'-diacetylbacillosamine 2-epimerase (hydrolysing)